MRYPIPNWLNNWAEWLQSVYSIEDEINSNHCIRIGHIVFAINVTRISLSNKHSQLRQWQYTRSERLKMAYCWTMLTNPTTSGSGEWIEGFRTSKSTHKCVPIDYSMAMTAMSSVNYKSATNTYAHFNDRFKFHLCDATLIEIEMFSVYLYWLSSHYHHRPYWYVLTDQWNQRFTQLYISKQLSSSLLVVWKLWNCLAWLLINSIPRCVF